MQAKNPIILNVAERQPLHVLGTQVRFLCEADKTDHAWSLMEVTLPYGAGPPAHEHAWDEAYFVIEGELDFILAGVSHRVRSGEFVYAPGGLSHGFSGASSTPARVLIFDAPAHAESFFREVDAEIKSPEDFARIPVIGQRNGIHFAAPQ